MCPWDTFLTARAIYLSNSPDLCDEVSPPVRSPPTPMRIRRPFLHSPRTRPSRPRPHPAGVVDETAASPAAPGASRKRPAPTEPLPLRRPELEQVDHRWDVGDGSGGGALGYSLLDVEELLG